MGSCEIALKLSFLELTSSIGTNVSDVHGPIYLWHCDRWIITKTSSSNLCCILSVSWFTLRTIFSKLVIYAVILPWFCWTFIVFQSTIIFISSCCTLFTLWNLLLVWVNFWNKALDKQHSSRNHLKDGGSFTSDKFVHYSTENWKDEAMQMISPRLSIWKDSSGNKGGFASHECSSVHKKHLR